MMLGFFTVAIGWIGYMATVWSGPSPSRGWTRANIIFGVGSVLGYGVLAVASWSWLKWIENSPVRLAGLSRVLKFFAIGNLLLAAGLASIGYFQARQAVTFPYDGHVQLVAAGSWGLEFFGFLLVAVAFWDASSKISAERADPSTAGGGLLTP